MSAFEEKYVLCNPLGGLNDCLCQIQKCLDYCARHNRTLILSDFWNFERLDWKKYIEVKKISSEGVPIIVKNNELFENFKSLSCYPNELFERWDSYELEWPKDGAVWLLKGKKKQASFNFSTEYVERILVHSQCGGGETSLRAITNFTLKPYVRNILHDLRAKHTDYIAVHIRNTDYRSNYEDFLKELYQKHSNEKFLVCSDDTDCKSFSKELFGDNVFFSSDTLKIEKNLGLHDYETQDEKVKLAIGLSVFLDLVMLALGKQMHFAKLQSTATHNAEYSGFSMLAYNLFKHKDVLENFLG